MSGSQSLTPFGTLCREFLAEEFEASPVLASSLGLTDYDGRLDDLSAAAWEARRRRSSVWLERFKAVPDAQLGLDEGIDRDLLVSTLTGRIIMAEWEAWRRQPEIYSVPASMGSSVCSSTGCGRNRRLVRDAVARLRAIPETLEHGRSEPRPEMVAPVFVGRAIGQARGRRPLRPRPPAGRDAGARARAALAEAGTGAAAAFDGWSPHSSRSLRDRATGSFALGESRYSRLLRDKEHIPLDAGALRERGRAEYERLSAELQELSRRVAGRATGRPSSPS